MTLRVNYHVCIAMISLNCAKPLPPTLHCSIIDAFGSPELATGLHARSEAYRAWPSNDIGFAANRGLLFLLNASLCISNGPRWFST